MDQRDGKVDNISHNHAFDRVGDALKAMYCSPPVQAFLNGVPSKELFEEKQIYQHGTLRKVWCVHDV